MLRNKPILFQLLTGGIALVGIVGLLSSHLTAQTQDNNPDLVETDGYTLSIKPEAEKLPPGEALRLVITLKNISKQEKRVLNLNPLLAYNFEVTLPNKEKAPLTLHGQRFMQGYGKLGLSAESRTSRLLKPGEFCTDVIVLNRVFDMSLNGRYKILASRKTGESGSRTESLTITSNTAEVVIDETLNHSWPD